MGRLCAFLSGSPNPFAELAATTTIYWRTEYRSTICLQVFRPAQRRCVAVQSKITHHNIPLAPCPVHRSRLCGPVNTGFGRCEGAARSASGGGQAEPGSGRLACTVLGRDRLGWVGLHLARAVVPPPRLRAKSVSISAHLQHAYHSARWASPERTGVEKTLQIPARTPYFLSDQERYSRGLFSGDPRETSNLSMWR